MPVSGPWATVTWKLTCRDAIELRVCRTAEETEALISHEYVIRLSIALQAYAELRPDADLDPLFVAQVNSYEEHTLLTLTLFTVPQH